MSPDSSEWPCGLLGTHMKAIPNDSTSKAIRKWRRFSRSRAHRFPVDLVGAHIKVSYRKRQSPSENIYNYIQYEAAIPDRPGSSPQAEFFQSSKYKMLGFVKGNVFSLTNSANSFACSGLPTSLNHYILWYWRIWGFLFSLSKGDSTEK